MLPCGGELEGAARAFLSAHIGEIERTAARLAVTDDVIRRLELAAQIGSRVRKMTHADGLDSRERGLGARVVGADDPLQTRAAGPLGDGQHAADAAQAAVEGELSARRMLRETFPRQLVRRGEEREGDRQVEAGALLLQLCRGQIDRDPATGPLQLGGQDPASDPLPCLLAGAVGEPDDRQRRRLAALNVRLHLDTTRLEADEGKGDRAREHHSNLRVIV